MAVTQTGKTSGRFEQIPSPVTIQADQVAMEARKLAGFYQLAAVTAQTERAAKQGGTIAGTARRELEQKTGRSVISKKNFLLCGSEKMKQISNED